MKKYSKFIPILAIALSALTFTSCFKDEPLNAECDIEQAFIPNNGNWEECFLKATDTLQNVMSTEDEISFLVKREPISRTSHRNSRLHQALPYRLPTVRCRISPTGK